MKQHIVFYDRHREWSQGECKNMKKYLCILCLFIVLLLAPSVSAFGAFDECFAQLMERFPDMESIKDQFIGRWQETTEPNRHEDGVENTIGTMSLPEIEISGMEAGADKNFILLLVDVKKPDIVDFFGINIGSAREDVISKFGEPDSAGGNLLSYGDDFGYSAISFIFADGRVAQMTFQCWPD
jgi:hypothetical protein